MTLTELALIKISSLLTPLGKNIHICICNYDCLALKKLSTQFTLVTKPEKFS